MQIIKYILEPKIGVQSIVMPVGCRLLSSGCQHGKIAMWFLRPDVKSVEAQMVRTFEVFYTGDNVPFITVQGYIGTFVFDETSYVFHVFEIVK